ncbi:tail fiber assembly protein [Pseudomonas alliivorans]|nr:tail fiber assembly protein [Pseudomonas alliivorans]
MAKAKVPFYWDMPWIRTASGQLDFSMSYYDGEYMHIEGVTQEAMDAAIASYDHNAYLQRQKAFAIRTRRDELLAASAEVTSVLIDGYVTGILTEEEKALFEAHATFKVQLYRVDKQETFPDSVVWPVTPA